MRLKQFFFILLLLPGINGYSQVTNILLSDTVRLNELLEESSGLVFVDGKLWTHNDSGGRPEIYAVDPDSGDIIQTVTLTGINNNDWEDLAASGEYLYIADTGNNITGARTDLAIHKIRLKDIPQTGDVSIPFDKIETIHFYYPEQDTLSVVTGSNNTPYDCEAIIVVNDTIRLFTKDWTSAVNGYGTSEYLLPVQPLPNSQKYAAEFFKRHDEIGFLVTGADHSESGRVILIGYGTEAGFGNHMLRLYSDFKNNDISTGTVFVKSIGTPLSVGQAEGICFGENDLAGFISNERFSASLFSFSIDYPAALRRFIISEDPNDAEEITPIEPDTIDIY